MARLRGLSGGFWLRCVLVAAIGWFYVWTAVPEWRPGIIGATGDGYYNLLMRGFTKGTLSLDTPVDPLLATMSNPWDPNERGEHGLHDASYYKGRYYLYFGPAPVLLLFLPFHLATGEYVSETLACPIFAFLGLVASVWLLMAVRRRYFPATSEFAASLCVAALGLANLMPILLRRSNVWEVPITCAYFCAMVGLCCMFKALHDDRKKRWLALASVAFGFAVASRPTYLFGCAALLVPIIAYGLGRRDGRPWAADAGFRRIAMAGILPLAGIGLLMAIYNFERFGSPLDFGFRRLMNGEQVWKEDLFALRFFVFNIWVYAFAPAHWVPFFPYVSVASLPMAPAGHPGSEDPFGVIPNVPFVLLAAFALFLLSRRLAWPRHLRLMCLAVAIEAAGTGLATSAFGGAINRYEVDFMPSLIILACVGWLAISDSGRNSAILRSLSAVGVSLVLGYSVLFNVLASFGHNGLFRAEHPALYHRIAHRWNAVSVKLGEWRGVHYGPVELTVVFPDDKEGQVEPLVVTGCEFLSEYLVVHYDGPGLISFALEHSSHGHFVGPQLEVAPRAEHKVVVEMGSLYPPPEHPFFDGLTPAEAELCQKTLRVSVDGQTALQRDIPFFDAASFQPSIGVSGDRPGYDKPFSGRIVSWQRLPIDLLQPEKGPVSLKVQFPPFTGARSEPLVSTGEVGKGDLLFVRYLGPDYVSLGFDHRGAGAIESSPIAVDYGSEHSVEIDSDALRTLEWPIGAERSGKICVRFDGRTVFYEQMSLFPTRLETVTVGINRSGSSTSEEMFSGQIFDTRHLGFDAPAGPEGKYGPVDLEFRLPAASASHLPLVSTGRTGKGDALYIRWSGPGMVRLGYDHWGDGVIESGDIPMSADTDHFMSISIPSLLSPGPTQADRVLAQCLRVELDGSVAWAQRVSSHPALATEAYFVSNGIGASSCERDFKKGVAWFERKPGQEPDLSGKGAVALRLKLPQGMPNLAEPLLAVGRTGRADVLFIRYIDAGHVSFGIDHWGKSLSTSDPVAVDYDRLHDVAIEMPNIDPSASESELAGEARVWLDGNLAWRSSQNFYATELPFAIAENPIGASSCGAEFSGGLIKIFREPDRRPPSEASSQIAARP
jgi:hypothetical protein